MGYLKLKISRLQGGVLIWNLKTCWYENNLRCGRSVFRSCKIIKSPNKDWAVISGGFTIKWSLRADYCSFNILSLAFAFYLSQSERDENSGRDRMTCSSKGPEAQTHDTRMRTKHKWYTHTQVSISSLLSPGISVVYLFTSLPEHNKPTRDWHLELIMWSFSHFLPLLGSCQRHYKWQFSKNKIIQINCICKISSFFLKHVYWAFYTLT